MMMTAFVRARTTAITAAAKAGAKSRWNIFILQLQSYAYQDTSAHGNTNRIALAGNEQKLQFFFPKEDYNK